MSSSSKTVLHCAGTSHRCFAWKGYHVTEASDGTSGFTQARVKLPDLILCDIMMPGLDGHQVLKEIRADETLAAIPFIFMTARGEIPDIRRGMSQGADDYLPKPFELSDLLDAVRSRLIRHAQQRSAFVPKFDDAQPLEKLGISPRESEILLWIAQGKSNQDIADILNISLGTVKKHVHHVFEKLGVETRSAALLCALEALADTKSDAHLNLRPIQGDSALRWGLK